MVSREELLDRWRGIEEEDDDQDESDPSPSKHLMIRQLKERWFSDTFNFLIGSPVETHLWCGFWDLMGPLLETFHSYFNDKKPDSPLKLVWQRVSRELRQCTQCICQHHQAQETYNAEYESETVGPLLKVLQCLDEERVSEHLQEINARVSPGAYDPESHGAEVVSIMFEVLMFPTLLDDQSLVTEFERFIVAIDNSHELSLAGHQQYPGVYALLFLRNSRARAIGLRLAGCLGKLRKATDLEPLQPLLRKCMIILETEVLPANLDSSRPRVHLERVTAWLGLKALLGCLESLAFEEGILERHPIFLSTVLNHVSDDTPEFSYAVTCLRLFFEMLGCKLWLRTSVSPSMMRNTLLGQCFHTEDEKSHKEIFDLFLPFLQSLEALQDGEHEKQRRHFLYFLLHQVTHSRNFSGLMRKNACKIALLIIQRGYMMNPPCPPFECSHMWGPSLVSSLKDISLHNSLRQPALDLIQTIIVSDCAALASIQLKISSTSSGANAKIFSDLYDEDEFCLSRDLQENNSCWNAFCFQSKIAAEAYKDWKCIPMLWLDVFVGIDPLVLPISFSKAVIWVLSHFSFFDSDNNMESKLSVSEWLSSYAGEISNCFVWEVPKGYDDGGDGKVSKSSVNASLMCIPLIRAFKRCAVHYIIVMEQRELQKQWTWEPRMAESLILLLISPNDTARRVNRIILEHVSKTHGLTSGLQFLCSNVSSLSSMYMGLKYATMQVQVDCNSSIFCNLHHLFFVVRKLLKEAIASPWQPPKDFKEELTQINHLKLLSEGGFLRKPCSIVSPVRVPGHSSSMEDVKSWDKFCCLISAIVWPSILKCLVEGKRFIDCKNCQMTCVRLLEILPVLFERVNTSWPQHSQSLEFPTSGFSNFNWLVDLVDWGKSSLVVVIRHWKQSILQLMNLLRNFQDVTKCTIDAIEKFMSYDTIVVDDLKELLSQSSLSLSMKASCTAHGGSSKTAPSVSAASYFGREIFAAELSIRESEGLHLNDLSVTTADKVDNREKDMVVILSDDENEKMPTPGPILSPSIGSMDERNEVYVDKSNSTVRRHDHQVSVTVHASEDTMEHSTVTKVVGDSREASFQESNDVQSNSVSSKLLSIAAASLVNSSSDPGKQKMKKPDPALGSSFGIPVIHKTAEQSLSSRKTNAHKSDSVIKEVTSVANDNALDLTVTTARHSSSLLTKPLISVPKRKVVQLQMPMNNKVGHLSRVDTGSRSFRPPRLDDWYRPILELDYFSLVGSCSGKEENITAAPSLKAVPLCFHSKDHYVEIFRPLVLEEFKAQMHSSNVEASSSEDMCCGILCVISVERIDDFHLVRGSPEECESSASREYLENDIVLLTKEPLQNSSQPLHALGKVERRERNNKTRSTILSIRVYFQSALPRLVKMKKFLIERSKWHISRIMSITPQLREFQALSSLNNIPLLPLILNPTDSTSSYAEPRKAEIDKLPEPMQRTLKSSFNISQIQAISVAIRSQGPTKAFELSLIHGPPGTGKTRTIVAIVSALLAVGSPKGVSSKAFNNSSSSHDTAFISPRAQVSQAAAIARAWQDAALAKQITKDEVKAYSGAMPRSLKRRVLICAQSNAAVDELVSRINSGLCGSDGKIYKPFLVRVGNVKTVHPNSLPFFIDTLVEQRLAEDNSTSDRKRDVDSSMLRTKLEKIVDSIRLYESMRAKARDSDMETKSSVQDGTSKVDDVKELSDAEIGAKLNSLYAQKKSICGDIAAAQAQERKSFEESKLLKNKIRKSIIREAEIVVATLSGCGGDIYGVCSDYSSCGKFGSFSEHSLFDAVVIDEAAQALEPATLIPLQLLKSHGTKCVMVGDPKQLPATVLSNLASKYLFQCSMFERLQRAGHPVIMLTEQYRMHPEICKFPSCHFYENKLLNGAHMISKTAPFHENSFLGPYLFFDIVDGRECQGRKSGSLSLYNEAEAEAVVEILKFFRKRYSSEFLAGRIGLITPYKSQLSVLRSRCNSEFGPSVTGDMEFNTVDGFQGREVDILLLSTVRASDSNARKTAINSGLIGFVADVRRMNVALTRARLSLWIIGNSRTLQTNFHWTSLIKDAKERDLFISLSRPYKSCLEKSSSSSKDKNRSTSLYPHSRHHEQDVIPQGGRPKEGKTKPMNWESEKHKVKHVPSYKKQEISSNADLSSDHQILKDQKTSASTLRREHTEKLGGKDKVTQRKKFDCADEKCTKRVRSKSIENKSATKVKQRKEKTALETVDSSSRNTSQIRSNVPEACTYSYNEKEADHKKNDGDQDTAHKSLIATRKRQREAVDSLLSSSLISSKKSGVSSHVRKPVSQSIDDGNSIRPIRPTNAKSNNIKRHFDE